MHPRSGNDAHSIDNNPSIQSKPFSLKKGGAVSEARIWKPDDLAKDKPVEPLSSISSNNSNLFNFNKSKQPPAAPGANS